MSSPFKLDKHNNCHFLFVFSYLDTILRENTLLKRPFSGRKLNNSTFLNLVPLTSVSCFKNFTQNQCFHEISQLLSILSRPNRKKIFSDFCSNFSPFAKIFEDLKLFWMLLIKIFEESTFTQSILCYCAQNPVQ